MQLHDLSPARSDEPPKSGPIDRGPDTTKPAADPESSPDRARLLDLVYGFRATCIIPTALELVEALRGPPLSEERLAGRLGADRICGTA